MKKLTLIAVIILLTGNLTFSQVTKSDIENSLKWLGSDISAVTTLKMHKPDGEKDVWTKDEFGVTIELGESSLILKSRKEGIDDYLEIVPYNKIYRIRAQKTFLGIFYSK